MNCDVFPKKNLPFASVIAFFILAATGLILAAIVTKLFAFLFMTYHLVFDCNTNCGPSGIPEGAGGGAAGSALSDPQTGGVPTDSGTNGPNLADGMHMTISQWGPLPIIDGGHGVYVAVSPMGPLPIIPDSPGSYIAVSPMGPLPVARTDGGQEPPHVPNSPGSAFNQLAQESGGGK